MTSTVLHEQAKRYKRPLPELRSGFTVRVHERVKEGEKERVQIFEGLIISIHRGHSDTDATFTVRKIASGVGVERIFPFSSPFIEKIVVTKVAKVRRARLSFLRGRKGKSARMSERFTNSDEFAAVALPPQAAAELVVEEAATAQEESKKEEAPAQEKGK